MNQLHLIYILFEIIRIRLIQPPKIRCSVPQSSNVELKVFDILGNEIETLVNEEKPAGTYEINLGMQDSYQAAATSIDYKQILFMRTKKMVLLK
ncbi:MAG: hypothetical protein MZV64_31295 [Ignavibacteriales bacterium]|nr:hypothetical protein [Ignavibacteriales bacterium]